MKSYAITTHASILENSRLMLCKCGAVKIISDLVEARENYKEIECTDNILKKMADMVVLLTSGGKLLNLDKAVH